MGFSRQEHWSGLACPPPGDLPNPGAEPTSLMSPALTGVFFITSATQEALLETVTVSKPKPCWRDFPGGLVGKTLCSQCRGSGLGPWSGD